MRPRRTPGTGLWRDLVENLDSGLVVFNDHGVVIYANDEAGRLLGYPPRDVLDLDREDFAALVSPNRLDGAPFISLLEEGRFEGEEGCVFQVMTSDRRLEITPQRLDLEGERVLVLSLHRAAHWRAELIAETVIADLESPLHFAANYSEALLSRLESGDTHLWELRDFARIIREGMARSLAVWESLTRLYRADPAEQSDWDFQALDLMDLLQKAAEEVVLNSPQTPYLIQLHVDEALPLVRASAAHLGAALSILLGWATREVYPEALIVRPHATPRYVQVDLACEKHASFGDYTLDDLPLAVVEQMILQHGGRIRAGENGDPPLILSLSLPLSETPASE
jgi:PAS domain S-box-containing protein